jgi:hypothetical protein
MILILNILLQKESNLKPRYDIIFLFFYFFSFYQIQKLLSFSEFSELESYSMS